MSKLKMHTPDLTATNIDRLAALFPNCVTESRDEKGQLRKSVDFDLLRQELSGAVVEGLVERYTLNWPGKSAAIVAANAPVYKTLRPCEAESVDFATTKNLYIEGDNLEVLKLLQETYLGKIKMIYIDPPYNTGNDFIYDDDFAEDKDADLIRSAQKDASGGRLVANPESNGRFHSDWLSMIYPRLKIARDLLREDGIIFISINDNESHNLRKICDELFGAHNFVAQFVWNTEGHTDNQFEVKINHEYVCAYSKNILTLKLGWVVDPNTRKDSNLWKGFAENSITKNGPANPPTEILIPAGFPCKSERLNLASNTPPEDFFNDVDSRGYISRQLTDKYSLEYPIRKSDLVVREFKLQNDVPFYSGWSSLNKLKTFIASGFKPLEEEDGKCSFYLSENGVLYYRKERNHARNILSVLRSFGTTEQMRSELEQMGLFFTYPKPKELLKYLLSIGGVGQDDIVFDFFSGSATTAHGVMQLNTEDGGNRRFIMVQLPEVCDDKSEAFKSGYKTICEIGKERIRRGGKKIKEENATNAPHLDVGFRVFKLDSSNMKDVYYTPDATEQSNLDLFADAIKEDRTAEDLLFQVFLDCGLDLALPVAKEKVGGKTVFVVDQNVMVACFSSDIPESLIRELAKRKPLKAVFLDRSFAKDSTKLNVTQIFKQLSPATEVKTL